MLSFYNGIYRYRDAVFRQFLPNADRGCNSNTVFSMLEHAKENYLVGTDNGAFWFDGITFQPFIIQEAMPSVQFHSVVKLSDGSVVFAGDSCIYRYSRRNGVWNNTGFLNQKMLIYKLFTHRNEVWRPQVKAYTFIKTQKTLLRKKLKMYFYPGTM